MGKLDVGEILAKKSATQKNIASMLQAIADIQSATKFLAEMTSFKGKGADAFQDYMRDQHVTYQNQMATALIDYNSTLESVQQAFIETVEETSETAKIYSGDLLTFVDDINKAKRGVEETVSAFNSAANTVKYIVDFTNPKDDHVVDALKSAAKSVNKTYDNYVEWSNNNKDQLDEYNDRFRKLMNAASTMSGISGQGIAGYSMSMKKLNKQIKGISRDAEDDNQVRVTAYENKYAKMRVVDVEKETGIKKPGDMSASKYRQLSAYVQAQVNTIPGLTAEQEQAMAEKYFITLQGTKPADWPEKLKSIDFDDLKKSVMQNVAAKSPEIALDASAQVYSQKANKLAEAAKNVKYSGGGRTNAKRAKAAFAYATDAEKFAQKSANVGELSEVISKRAPIVGGVVDVAGYTADGASVPEATVHAGANVMLGIVGDSAGAEIGASIGTLTGLPVVGTVGGAVVGAIISGILVYMGDQVVDSVNDSGGIENLTPEEWEERAKIENEMSQIVNEDTGW